MMMILTVLPIAPVVSAGCLSVTHVLWLNGTLKGSAMVLLYRAMTSSYRLSTVTICSGLTANFNAEFLPSAYTHHPRAPNYRILALIVAFYGSANIACMKLLTSGKSLLLRDRKSDTAWLSDTGGMLGAP